MRTDRLAVNMLGPDATNWYLGYLAAIDARDSATYGGYLAEDAELVMNNGEAIIGRQAILAQLGSCWQSFAALEHDLLAILGTDRHLMLEAWNHYDRLDGRRVSVRAVAVTRRNADGLVESAHIFGDTSPLFS